ncbi:sugar ABC transporter ATP-binding protein [Ruegeria sp. EL01]|jgi:ABC-type sugar transport system ATPase subunit|uniref:sugar ABC transporter ATP-binding protein n=1 Tax=Ruegeria sp. EL01 TaxID=2107578 RepID=UPI000EA8216B|nr:sugar ABC transporter ATP-binding protein [Ruegeria sp. EL01]
MNRVSQTSCLKIEGISKAFNNHQVLSDISLEIEPGEIRALLGANGAGKSTLIKILSGALVPDNGEIFVSGKPVQTGSIGAARSAGIAVVNQELMLFPDRSVAENIVAANISAKPFVFLSATSRRKMARQILDRLGSTVDVDQRLEDLSLSDRQFVEIARALCAGGDLLILDEPTSALSAVECDGLFKALKVLASQGTAIVFVSHRLDEVKELTDSVTILRDGKLEGNWETSSIDIEGITHAMVGDVEPTIRRRTGAKVDTNTVLELKNIETDILNDVSLSIKEGQIVGFAGLEGSGTSALLEVMGGVIPTKAGDLFLDEIPKSFKHVAEAIADGLVFMPPERKHGGLWLDRTSKYNIAAAFVQRLAPLKLLNDRKITQTSLARIEEVQVRTTALDTELNFLSGGNQQRVLLGRCLEQNPRILLLNDFTRGVDVKAKGLIHDIVVQLASEGMTICIVSSEFGELIQICDRIICMQKGQIVAEVAPEDVDDLALLRLASSTAT